MSTPSFWLRYQTLRNRLHRIRENIIVAGIDVETMLDRLPSDNYPERDLQEIVKEAAELHRLAENTLRVAREKHQNGIEADARIDQLIAGTVQ